MDSLSSPSGASVLHHFLCTIYRLGPSGSFSNESGSSYGVHQEDDEDPYGAKKLDLYGHVFPPRERHDTLAFVGCMEPTGIDAGIFSFSRSQSKSSAINPMNLPPRDGQALITLRNTHIKTHL